MQDVIILEISQDHFKETAPREKLNVFCSIKAGEKKGKILPSRNYFLLLFLRYEQVKVNVKTYTRLLFPLAVPAMELGEVLIWIM